MNFQNRNTAITPAINAPISYDGTGPVPAQKIDGDNTFIAGPYTYGGIMPVLGSTGPPEPGEPTGPARSGDWVPDQRVRWVYHSGNQSRPDVEGVPPGAPAVFQVRAWDAGVPDVDSYEEAEVLIGSEHLVYRGKSPLLSLALGGGGAPPADLIGLEPFQSAACLWSPRLPI